jgi:hypothetical protein
MQVAALRRTAAELEVTANRLEEIELYQQADTLRVLAQRLRADGRTRLARTREREPAVVPGSAPYPQAGPEDGGPTVYRDPVEPHDHADVEVNDRSYEERSVIVGPAPE